MSKRKSSAPVKWVGQSIEPTIPFRRLNNYLPVIVVTAGVMSGLPLTVMASPCANVTISANTTATQSIGSGCSFSTFSITANGTINVTNGIGINNSGTIGLIENSGNVVVSGAPPNGMGLVNSGTITTLNNLSSFSGAQYAINNSGLISTLTNSGSINNFINKATGTINSFLNSGNGTLSTTVGINNFNNSGIIINLTNTGLISQGSAPAFSNNALISTLTNSGIINGGGTGGTGIMISGSSVDSNNVFHPGATITSLTNNGTISSNGDTAINTGGLISTLNNIGLISSNNTAIYNTGSITNLTNSGSITGNGSCTDNIHTINCAIRNGGVINTLTNTGVISGATVGIFNGDGGTITSLNNAQGKSTSPLTFTGTLPTNYNIIVKNNGDYGQLSLNSTTISGVMNIGVSTIASAATPGTLIAVLSGISSQALIGNLSGTTISGVSGAYSWILQPESGNATIYDLLIAAYSGGSTNGGTTNGGSGSTTPASSSTTNTPTTTNITTGTSVSLSSIGTTYNSVLAGGTLVLQNGNQSGIALTISSAGGTITAPNTGAAQLSGVLSGPGNVIYNGAGLLNLTGSNTYSGGSSIISGTIVASGTSPFGTGGVYIGAQGTLIGAGTVTGLLVVFGKLQPGNSPGYLLANSTVTMNSGSTYLQDIAGKLQANAATPLGSTGYYSFLNVNGASLVIYPGATLSPRLQNLFSANEPGYGSAPYVPLLGDRFTIATAQGGISGKFSSVAQPSGLTTGTQFIPFYNIAGNNSLELAVIPTSYTATLANTNANTRSVAGALDQLSAATQADAVSTSQLALMYATADQTASSLATFAQSLAGEIYGATLAVVAQTTQRVQSAVVSRLANGFSLPTMQAGVNTETSALVTPQNPAGIPGSNVSSNPDVNPRATPSNSGLARGNVWGEIAYQYGNRAGNDKASGFSSNLYQMVLGVDGYKEHGIAAGGGIALSNTNVSANLGSGTVQQGSLFLYGKMPVESFMVDVMASYGLNATDNSRADPLSNGSLQAKGVRGNDALLSAGLSRAFETESARITPYIRMTWQQVNQSSFGEGSSPAALNVNSFSGNGLLGVLGLTVSGKDLDPMKASYTYRANLGVGADTNTLINPTLNATLAGFGTTIQTPNVGSTFVQAGLYGTAKFADNAYAYAGITGETRSGQTLGAVSLGVRIQF